MSVTERPTPDDVNRGHEPVVETTHVEVLSLEQLRRQRTNAKRRITIATKNIEINLGVSASRTFLRSLDTSLTAKLDSLSALNDVYLEQLGDSEAACEEAIEWFEAISLSVVLVNSKVKEELDIRADEAPTEISSAASNKGKSVAGSVIAIATAGQDSVGQTGNIEKVSAYLAAQQRYHADVQDRALSATDGATEARESPKKTPMTWIQDYVRDPAGHCGPQHGHAGKKSLVKVELSTFRGDRLEWLSWSGLFRALVHENSTLTTYEKMSVLQSKVDEKTARIIKNIPGDAIGYARALQLLEDQFGKPTDLKSVHLKAVVAMEPIKRAEQIEDFVHKLRAHLTVLLRYYEPSPMCDDFIDKIAAKLPHTEQVAWSRHCLRILGEDDIPLSEFDRWLGELPRLYKKIVAAKQVSEPARAYKAKVHTVKSTKSKTEKGCTVCGKEEHKTKDCGEMSKLPISERWDIVRKKGLCFSCLEKHRIAQCPSKKECNKDGCSKSHHPLLHQEEVAVAITNTNGSKRGIALGLTTAIALDKYGQRRELKVLIDEGSDTTMISEKCRKLLGLQGKKGFLSLTGATGEKKIYKADKVKFDLMDPGQRAKRQPIKAWSLDQVASPIEPVNWPKLKLYWDHLKDLPLKEIKGGRIDVLLGLDHAHLVLPQEVRSGAFGEPYAIKTDLGWIARGKVGQGSGGGHCHYVSVEEIDLEKSFKRFWDAENFGTNSQENPTMSPDDQKALDKIQKGTMELGGAYEVALPWRDGEPNLPNNRILAEKRFQALLRRFEKDPEYAKSYRDAINKYLSEGYAHKISKDEDLHGKGQWYLPHHGVFKKSATSKKVRVVFDATAEFEGKSLNKALLTGPALQNELPQVLLRFRQFDVAVGGDIEAMFSRVRLCPEDARYHRFLWQEDEAQAVETYQMDRLAFGDGPSPCAAISTMFRIAEDHGTSCPEAVEAIHKKFYVDDYLNSSTTTDEAIKVAKDVRDTLSKGDLHVKKWVSNSKEVMTEMSIMSNEEESDLGNPDPDTKMLGVKWNTGQDTLTFATKITDHEEMRFTRRELLSKLAGVFSPLGLAMPHLVKAKIKMKRLTLLGLQWDDPVPDAERDWWSSWVTRLKELQSMKIPRCLLPDFENVEKIEMHTFTDASEEAFAAVVYIRSICNNGKVAVRLAMSKSKVAPRKAISVAKLELQGALLGARLSRYVESALSVDVSRKWFWTDSTCVRGWIRSSASFYKPFVGNRIGEIQTLTDAKDWRHLAGKLNVADHATRSELKSDQLIHEDWINGSPFLYDDESEWPKDLNIEPVSEEKREKWKGMCLATTQTNEESQVVELEKFGILWKAQRVAGWVYRFTQILKGKKPVSPHLTVDEIKGGTSILIHQSQVAHFANEIKDLKSGKPLSKKSRLLSLTPFLDKGGILRVGGRIGRSPLPYDARHPAILSPDDHLARLIIQFYHHRLRHTGTNFVLAALRQAFWIIRGREAVKKLKERCKLCQVENARPAEQLMSELPTERLDKVPMVPFYHSSVDYFGPFEVLVTRNKTCKRYGVLFTCMTTRAVHIELAESLSTPDFLDALRRMINTRGSPETLYSDNGTNFVGAENEMKPPLQKMNDDQELKENLVKEGIHWKFQPPAAPHWGGVHESLVRSVKNALYRTLEMEMRRRRKLYENELRTLLCEIMGFLNARPLTYESSDPDDFRALTPNHFLIGRASATVPPGKYDQPSYHNRYRYRHVQHLTEMIWKRWMEEYLPTLMQRSKWHRANRNFEVDDVVLVLEPNLLRGKWRMGRIVTTYPGKDGLVRAVLVKTAQGTYKRPITKLCPLELKA